MTVLATSAKMVKPGTEELRQKVFSSTHMSTMVKTTQATITYPCCSYCGGYLNSSPKRKVVFGQVSLYTNPSESFIVWYKKHDEPKGLLWLRSCCIKKGHGETQIQLITTGCRERCSYTLSFLALPIANEWYRTLKQESRKAPSISGGMFCEELDSASSLDSILNEVTTSHSDSDENWSDDMDRQSAVARDGSFAGASVSPVKRNSKVKYSVVSVHGPRSASPVMSSSVAGAAEPRTVEMLQLAVDPSEDHLSRWSWPLDLKV